MYHRIVILYMYHRIVIHRIETITSSLQTPLLPGSGAVTLGHGAGHALLPPD